jgi:site-specific DNA-methyltransferase (adenine-specific)
MTAQDYQKSESTLVLPSSGGKIVLGDNLEVLRSLPDESFDLIYVDPPFNTGHARSLTSLATTADERGDRTGFAGRRYRTTQLGTMSYGDQFDDYMGFLGPRIVEMRRLLKATGSLYLHLDPRESHYAKVFCDEIFGRDCFLNEIIWAYDYGARTNKRWPAKHDDILLYVKDARHYWFDNESVDRIPYMAPGLVGAEKAAAGKLPTDVWWHTIVPTAGKERTGYPTQKPIGILRRVVAASCPTGGLVGDFFAGTGTTGAAASEKGCRFLMVDNNPEAVDVMERRFTELGVEIEINRFRTEA